jgi:type IV pilus assembly protein PilE
METDRMRTRQTGVTLMELLTVIVILGVISAVAVPSYRNYLVRTNRSDAKSALMQIQANQEKFYIQNNEYTDDLATKSPNGLGMAELTANRYYRLNVDVDDDGQGYTATATPTEEGGQDDDKQCGTFSINDAGVRDVTGTSDMAFCWK